MDRIEMLRNQYYESIKLLQNKEDIIAALPQPEFDNFFPIINGIMLLLEKEINNVEQELKTISLTDTEMLEYINDELNTLLFKKNVCISLIEKAQDNKKIEEEAQTTKKKNIIFATTESGNVCVESDLKNIPEEYLESIGMLLNKLQVGENEVNPTKYRSFTTINKKLNELHELKDFKVRLFYKNLDSDVVYVLMVRMKKSNNDALDRKEIIERVSQRSKQYEQLKKEIKDPIKREELIQEHQKNFDRLLGNIEHKKRG